MSGYSYWRLSLFYLFYFALLGGLVPYWSLYLDSLGFAPDEIGTLMAILMGTRIIAPNIWGWLADHTGARLRIIRLGSLIAWLIFTAAFWVQGYLGMALLMFLFTFFWNAVLPQFEALTLENLGPAHARYSLIRLWGSIGFILAVVGIGALLEAAGISALVWVLWVLLALILLSSCFVQRRGERRVVAGGASAFHQLRRPEVALFLLLVMLVQLGHGPYYTFFSLFMREQQYDASLIGLLWALGVVAEVGVFLIMHRLLSWSGLRLMFVAGLWICALRWLLISQWPDQLWVVLCAQLLHAVTFGCLHACSIALVKRLFPACSQGQGQAFYSSIGFGVGGALGAWVSGRLWILGGGEQVFLFAAVVSLLGGLLSLVWFRLAPAAE